MSVPSYEEMEAKRQEMISSFREIAAAMTRCVKVIEDYASLTPQSLPKSPSHLAAVPQHQVGGIPLTPATAAAMAGAVEKKERKKKEKKPRDPNAPKRPPSAYILFQNHIREEIRNSNPGMAYKDILGIIAQKWKELPDSSKKIYETAYSDAQGQYRVNEEAYQKTGVQPTIVEPTEILAAAAEASDSSDSSSDSDDSSDDSSSATPVIQSTSKVAKPPTTTTPLQVPPMPTLHAAVASPVVEPKKEKKRKNKADESAVAATLDPSLDKKKKKKSKE